MGVPKKGGGGSAVLSHLLGQRWGLYEGLGVRVGKKVSPGLTAGFDPMGSSSLSYPGGAMENFFRKSNRGESTSRFCKTQGAFLTAGPLGCGEGDLWIPGTRFVKALRLNA